MSLRDLIRKKDAGKFATAIPATSATQHKAGNSTVAKIATIAVAAPKEEKTAQAAYPDAVAAEPPPETKPPSEATEPFNLKTQEGLPAMADDGGFDLDAIGLTWHDDDRRLCVHCLNLRAGGICKVATPGGIVSAMKGYQPNQKVLQRCAGYLPCSEDPDQRPGHERWPGLSIVGRLK